MFSFFFNGNYILILFFSFFFDPRVFFFFFVLFFFFFPCCPLSMWKFLAQGWNPHHSSNPSSCSDSAGSLTHCTTRDPLNQELLRSRLCSYQVFEAFPAMFQLCIFIILTTALWSENILCMT